MGKWRNSTHPRALNEAAEALGPDLNPTPPAFVPFRPGPFLRPFDQRCAHFFREHFGCSVDDQPDVLDLSGQLHLELAGDS
jgi:hypothetical protein